jgi:hypothetical protein
MKPPKQSMRNVKAGRDARQKSDIAIEQTMDAVEAIGDVEQLITVVDTQKAAISSELVKLRTELTKYDPNATTELERLKKAEDAAKRGDSAGVVANLKGIARWVLDFSKEVGTTLVAKIIEKQMGL